jgi:hypothetical protein
VVKSLTKHANLDDTIDPAPAQVLEDILNLVRSHVAVNFAGL